MWRQGDILIAPVERLPSASARRNTSILAWGAVSGRSHRLTMPDTADLWDNGGMLFLRVMTDAATVIHEEHHAITLQRGVYRVWAQREYIASNIAPRPVLPEPADDDELFALVGAQLVDVDYDAGGERQLQRVVTNGAEDIVCLTTICPSTGQRSRIRVPPRLNTCHAAAAWVAGFDNPDDYEPLLET